MRRILGVACLLGLAFSTGAFARQTTAALSGEGPCKVYSDDLNFSGFKSYRWTGPCKEGIADGLGELEVILNNGDRLVWRHLRQRGRNAESVEERRVWRQGDLLSIQQQKDGRTQTRAIASDEVPDWARKFLMAGKRYPFRVVGSKCRIEVRGDEVGEWQQFSWNGPCENGRASGLGVLEVIYKDGVRMAWRHQRENAAWRGSNEEQVIFGDDGTFTRQTWENGKHKDTKIKKHDVPVWAQEFLYAAKPAAPALADPEGCKFSFAVPAERGRKDRWVGPCRNGVAEGTGVWLTERGTHKELRHLTMRDGSIAERHVVYERGESGNVWVTSPGSSAAKVNLDEAPAFVREFFASGKIPAEDAVATAPPAPPPPGTEALDAGACKVYMRRWDALRSLNWRGGCVGGVTGGLADGPGLLEIINNNNRVIQRVTASQGRIPAERETYSIHDQGGTSTYTGGKWSPLPKEQIPQWARDFLNAHPVIAAAPRPSVPAPQQQAAAPAEDHQAALARRQQEEADEQRRRRREEREEREERERESRERTNAYMEAFGSVMKGAADARRQQREAQERRQAQVAEVERQNQRYREQRAGEERRWQEEQQQRQRMQQAEQARQQEVQRQQLARVEEEKRRQPRWERVNIPAHTGCISLQWGKVIPQNTEQWYTIKNGCPMTLNVHWCDREGCTQSSSMATIAGGGSTRSWTLKKYGPAVNVIIACQVEQGGETVNFDRQNRQCYSRIRMQ